MLELLEPMAVYYMSISLQLTDHNFWAVTWKEGVGIKLKQNGLINRYRRMEE